MAHVVSPKRQAINRVKEAYIEYLDMHLTYEKYLEVIVESLRVEGVTTKTIEAAKEKALIERQEGKRHS